jgi:oligosaccharide repeat unit polymerase
MVNIDIQIKKHKKYFFILGMVAVSGLIFYFFRIVSSINFEYSISEYMSFNTIMYYAADKGNIPNIAVLMKIIDGWGTDIPFLYGESLFDFIRGSLPSALNPVGYQPSVIIKDVWYFDAPGGALPPTGMGEMFANFWYFGAVFGMYIFGAFSALIYNMLYKYNNFWYLVIYTHITLGFILLYSQGEFDNLSLWAVIPIGMTYIMLKILTKIIRNNKLKSLKDTK